MATIAAAVPLNGEALATATDTASTPAGDEISISSYRDGVLIFFDNGHASSITVTITPTVTSKNTQTDGLVTKAALTLAIAAGAKAQCFIPSSAMQYFKNASNRIPITYTSGNAALVLRAQAV